MEAQITVVEAREGEAPATHKHLHSEYHWRPGPKGFAECNTGARDPKHLRQEWILTGWRNEELNGWPFVPLDTGVTHA